MSVFEKRKSIVEGRYTELITRPNIAIEGNGIYERFKNPVLTSEMVPLTWRNNFNPETNPYFMERIVINATLNSVAIKWNDLMAPVVTEYIDDLMNVFFFNGRIADQDGKKSIYNISYDTRMHMITSSIYRLVDYCLNTHKNGLTTGQRVAVINHRIYINLTLNGSSTL